MCFLLEFAAGELATEKSSAKGIKNKKWCSSWRKTNILPRDRLIEMCSGFKAKNE